MNITTTAIALTVLALLLSAPLDAEPAASPLEGLWEVTSVTDLTTGKVEPQRREYHMYTATHEMIVLAGENRKKLKKSLSEMTAEEVMSQQPVGAGFYRYRIEGNKIIRTALLTLSAYYEGRTYHTDFELNGNTLTIRDSHAADGHERAWKMRRVE